MLTNWGARDLEFFLFPCEKHVVLKWFKIKKYPLFIIPILTVFFMIIRRRKPKSGVTFGGSCQIRTQLYQPLHQSDKRSPVAMHGWSRAYLRDLDKQGNLAGPAKGESGLSFFVVLNIEKKCPN